MNEWMRVISLHLKLLSVAWDCHLGRNGTHYQVVAQRPKRLERWNSIGFKFWEQALTIRKDMLTSTPRQVMQSKKYFSNFCPFFARKSSVWLGNWQKRKIYEKIAYIIPTWLLTQKIPCHVQVSLTLRDQRLCKEGFALRNWAKIAPKFTIWNNL